MIASRPTIGQKRSFSEVEPELRSGSLLSSREESPSQVERSTDSQISQDNDNNIDTDQVEEEIPSTNVELNDSNVDVLAQFTQNENILHKRRKHLAKRVTNDTDGSSKNLMDNSPAQAGIISSMTLMNFMCHEHFHLKFGKQTNFIIGHNGSGKSAVLTGISVGLGAKANNTDRGNSLKNLIMNGKNTSRIIIVFENKGFESYKPEIFGDKITIERVLKRDATGSYNIKNQWNKIISHKKSTLDDILEYYSITINNPMTILTQTDAKTFLANSTDEDKFKFFMVGTRLEEAIDNCDHIEKELKQVEKLLIKNKSIVQESERKFENSKKIWNEYKNVDEIREQQKFLHGKLIWLDITQQESKLTKAKLVLKERELLVDKLQIEIEGSNEMISELESERLEIITKNEEVESNKNQVNIELDQEKEILNQIKNEINEIDGQLKTYQKDYDSNKKEIKQLEIKIENEEIRLQSINGDTYDKILKTKEKNEDELKNVEKELHDVDNSREDIKNEKIELKQNFDSNTEEIKNSINKLKEDYNQLISEENGNNNNSNSDRFKYFAYGNNFTRLLNDIKLNANRFQEPIVGPIGLKIKLQKEYNQWGKVIETLLSNHLLSFIVQNYHDQRILSMILKKYKLNNNYNIIVRKNEIFNFENSKPENKELTTILDILQIEDKNIECYLVDSAKIHNTILTKDRKEGEIFLKNDRKISQCVCFIDERTSSAIRIQFRNNGFQTDPVLINERFRNYQLIERIDNESVDIKDKIKNEIANYNEQYKEINIQYKENVKKLDFKFQENKNHKNTLIKRSKQLNDIIYKFNQKLEEQANTGKLEALQEEFESLKTNNSILLQTLQTFKIRRDEKMFSINSLKNDFISKNDIYKKLIIELQENNKKIENSQVKINELKFKIKENKRQVEIKNNDINKLNEFIKDLPSLIEKQITQAEKYCQREKCPIDLNKDTEDNINSKLNSLNIRLKSFEEQIGISLDEARINLIVNRNNFIDSNKKLTEATNLHNHLKKSLLDRVHNLRSTRLNTCYTVNETFQNCLKLRGFRGELNFNFKERKLILKVSTKANESLRKIESFSGGEKSFSQIAFLLSIWKPMHSKIRGLDEFDVFMDQINRRLSLKLILEKVAEHPKTQTIFITPLNISKIEGINNDSVYIHEIEDPKRRNNSDNS
ncbi:hypothetical protein BVG19_g2781 [[Candida] boidinii]|nr:hypothetical protein BVG19_g2781 [[Candida] boidinii]OWB52850.1 hypothetical protein B5S27_g4433 [[Candida] boidinii]OWB67600.1 hypothetical protein B5S30_g2962 [[Candida] boidinii]